MITFGEVIILTFGSITAIQFINPIIRFRLKVFGNGWVWRGLLAGIALTIMGSFISNAFFSDSQKDFLNIVVGFLCIIVVFAPIMIVSRPIKYSLWNSEKYVQACKAIIISCESKDLISLLNEIDFSIDIIVKHYIKQTNTADIEKLFSLLVEPHICKLLVKQFPGLLSKFIQQLLKTKFGELDENSIAKSSVRMFLIEIILQAILDEDSIFYKSYLNNYLGDESTFIDLIFDNPGFVQSHFSPLKPLRAVSSNPLSNTQIELYTKIQDIILKRFMSCPNDFKEKKCILVPLHELIDSESAVIAKDQRLEDRKTLPYIERVQDYLLVNTISGVLEKVGKQEEKDAQEKVNDQGAAISNFEQDLIDMLVDLLLKHFAHLSKIKVKNNKFGLTLDSFWMYLDALNTKGAMGSKIQQKFEERIFKQLNNWHHIEPFITGCLINSLFWEILSLHHLPNSPIMSRWIGKFSEKFARYLRENFERTTLFGNDFFLKNLPENIRYDAINRILYIVPFGREHEESFLMYDHENQPNI